MQHNKVFVLGDNARVNFSGLLPYGAVGHAFYSKIAGVLRGVPLGYQPFGQPGRQIGVNEKPHDPAAMMG